MKIKLAKYLLILIGTGLFIASIKSCNQNNQQAPNLNAKRITEAEVIAAQKAWGISLIGIGVAYANEGDYTEAANKHVSNFYGFDIGKVLFKPSLAAEKPFRTTFDGALSYFIGDNDAFPQDEGFALKRWKNVQWENVGIINSNSDLAIAMGNYFFTDEAGEITKMEYTICYKKDDEGDLKIIAHKSAVPYTK